MTTSSSDPHTDHRAIGLKQKLFFFNETSPGSCFFLPHGTIIYNKLMDFLRNEYQKRGFLEVITPNMYHKKLWERSGHWQHYEKNMFKLNIDDNIYALKPMNCCAHCLMFEHETRSYRELPLRLADFGVLHRNEASGALTGLTRVRRFQQDDAHIFCTEEQVESEIDGCLDFLKYVYGIFGFEFSLVLSTCPDDYIGGLDTWNRAEAQLQKSLDKSGFQWELNPGDGAFYGPKIDITIKDALGRNQQCATIQLDFNLPERFDLSYQKSDMSTSRPVMIHRAILGSVERMIAILAESYAGRWPFWLSPRQICVVPVDPKFNNYANAVCQKYRSHGYLAEVDISTDKLKRKIRNAQLEMFNFVFVVGEKEETANTVNIRTRNGEVLGAFSHVDTLEMLYEHTTLFK